VVAAVTVPPTKESGTETREIAESLIAASWNGGKEPVGPSISDSYRLWVGYGKRVARAYLDLEAERDALRGELADTETEKIERGTEILRLREALTWIADPSYVGSYADDSAQVVEIHRKWAKNALDRLP
jgi:hypothetical protein